MLPEDELQQIHQQEHADQQQYDHRIYVCMGASCLAARSAEVKQWLEMEARQKGVEKTCSITGGGCRGLVRRRTDRDGRAGEHALRAGQGDRRGGHHRQLGQEEAGQAAAPADRQAVLQTPAAHRPGNGGTPKPGADRGIYRRRWLFVAAQSGHRDGAQRSDQRDHPQRTARARRRGLPDRAEVAHGAKSAKRRTNT